MEGGGLGPIGAWVKKCAVISIAVIYIRKIKILLQNLTRMLVVDVECFLTYISAILMSRKLCKYFLSDFFFCNF